MILYILIATMQLFLSNFHASWKIYLQCKFSIWQSDNEQYCSSVNAVVEGIVVWPMQLITLLSSKNFLFRAGSSTTSWRQPPFGDNEPNLCIAVPPRVGCCLTPPLLRHFLNRELAFEGKPPAWLHNESFYSRTTPTFLAHEISSTLLERQSLGDNSWETWIRGIASRVIVISR